MQANLNQSTQRNFQQRNSQTQGLSFHVNWQKDRVISVNPEAPLWEAAQLMKDHQIGDVLVMDRAAEMGRPLGMITDRDIALCMAEDIDFRNVRVKDLMSRSVVTASINDDLLNIIHLMKDSGVTRLPMVDEQGHVAGVLTAKNVLQILTHCFFEITQISEQQQENEQAHQH